MKNYYQHIEANTVKKKGKKAYITEARRVSHDKPLTKQRARFVKLNFLLKQLGLDSLNQCKNSSKRLQLLREAGFKTGQYKVTV